MKNLYFLLFLLIASSNLLIGQSDFDCLTENIHVNSPLATGDCDDYLEYIPNIDFNYQNTPILTFRISFHFMRDDNGGGVYQDDQTSNVAEAIQWLNNFYGNIQSPVLPVNPPAEEIDDSRVRFIESGIYYHDNS